MRGDMLRIFVRAARGDTFHHDRSAKVGRRGKTSVRLPVQGGQSARLLVSRDTMRQQSEFVQERRGYKTRRVHWQPRPCAGQLSNDVTPFENRGSDIFSAVFAGSTGELTLSVDSITYVARYKLFAETIFACTQFLSAPNRPPNDISSVGKQFVMFPSKRGYSRSIVAVAGFDHALPPVDDGFAINDKHGVGGFAGQFDVDAQQTGETMKVTRLTVTSKMDISGAGGKSCSVKKAASRFVSLRTGQPSHQYELRQVAHTMSEVPDSPKFAVDRCRRQYYAQR
jgi:hypothetical protein